MFASVGVDIPIHVHARGGGGRFSLTLVEAPFLHICCLLAAHCLAATGLLWAIGRLSAAPKNSGGDGWSIGAVLSRLLVGTLCGCPLFFMAAVLFGLPVLGVANGAGNNAAMTSSEDGDDAAAIGVEDSPGGSVRLAAVNVLWSLLASLLSAGPLAVCCGTSSSRWLRLAVALEVAEEEPEELAQEASTSRTEDRRDMGKSAIHSHCSWDRPATRPQVERVVVCGAVGTCLASWMSSAAFPLDWDRPWQQFPVPVVVGAVLGHCVGTSVSLISKLSGTRSTRLSFFRLKAK